MKSNNSDGIGLLITLVAIGFGLWLSDWVPFRSDVTIYQVYCKSEAPDGICKNTDEIPGVRYTYRPSSDSSAILVWPDGDAPIKYDNCAIIDVFNWSCPRPYDPHQMVNGVLDGRTDNMGYPHFVKKWQWWLLKFKRM